jgi:protoporphyrinogen/coproporphyrinogen III oxidase
MNASRQTAGARRRVVVVGAGISGLAAAWELARATEPPEVLVLEASSRAGGVLETLYEAPYLIERSADNFATLLPDALQLCREIGYTEHLITPQQAGRQAFVVRRGRLLPIPAGFSLMQPTRVWPVLTTPTLSLPGKLRMLGEYFIRARRDESDESLEAFALRRLGREAFEQLVEPIVSGIFTADPQRLSMLATLPQFVNMERKHGGLIRGHLAARRDDAAAVAKRASGARYDQFMAPREGMSHWVQHLIGSLPQGCLRYNSPVRGLEQPTPRRWRVLTDAAPLACDGVILALPTRHAAELVAPHSARAATLLRGIEYASSAVVVLIVDRHEIRGRIDGFGVIVPRKEQRPVLAISYSSNKYPGRAPDDQIMLRIFLGGALAPEMVERDDADLIHCAEQQVRELLQWTGNSPRWRSVVRWREAMPQYHVGHLERVRELEQALVASGPLRVCGAGYSGVGIPQSIRSGRKAARELLESWDGATLSSRR